MFRLAIFAISFLLGAAAAEAAPFDPVAESGYRESTKGRADLEKAVKAANALLEASSPHRLAVSWSKEKSGSFPGKRIVVHLVRPTKPPFVIQVPYNSCNCIFLQDDTFVQNLSRYSDKLKQMMKVDKVDMLTFILLHEVGHVDRGDEGYFDGAREPDANSITAQKKREREADEFAAKSLVSAADQKTNVTSFLASMRVQLALGNASWNLMALRLLDGFGGSILCRSYLFDDASATHPNFELRILTVNDIITNTPTSRELLQSFEACRVNSEGRDVIYRR